MKKITLLLLALFAGFTINGQNVVSDQPADTAGSALVDFEGNDGVGVYTADDFIITEDTVLGEIDIFGFLSNVLNFSALR